MPSHCPIIIVVCMHIPKIASVLIRERNLTRPNYYVFQFISGYRFLGRCQLPSSFSTCFSGRLFVGEYCRQRWGQYTQGFGRTFGPELVSLTISLYTVPPAISFFFLFLFCVCVKSVWYINILSLTFHPLKFYPWTKEGVHPALYWIVWNQSKHII